MITVDFSTLVFICVFLPVGIVLGLWLWRERLSANSVSFLDDEEVFRCTICTHVYLKKKDQSISRCPRCKSYN